MGWFPFRWMKFLWIFLFLRFIEFRYPTHNASRILQKVQNRGIWETQYLNTMFPGLSWSASAYLDLCAIQRVAKNILNVPWYRYKKIALILLPERKNKNNLFLQVGIEPKTMIIVRKARLSLFYKAWKFLCAYIQHW